MNTYYFAIAVASNGRRVVFSTDRKKVESCSLDYDYNIKTGKYHTTKAARMRAKVIRDLSYCSGVDCLDVEEVR
jgi:hypothetical protein